MKKNVRKVYQRLCCLLLCLTLLFAASLSGHAYTYIPPDPDEPVMGVSRIVGLTPASMTDEGKKMLEQADSPVLPSNTSLSISCPKAKDISFVRLFSFERGAYQDEAVPVNRRVYHIDDQDTIQQICNALLATNAVRMTKHTGVTGYEVSDYEIRYSLELHQGDSIFTWDLLNLSSSPEYLISVTDKVMHNFDDVPYQSHDISQLRSLLDQIASKDEQSAFTFLSDHPEIRRIDKAAHTYTYTGDLKNSDANALYESYQNMSTTWKEVLKGRQNPNIYFSFADEFTRLRVEPAVNGAYVFLEDDPSPNTMYKHYNFTPKEGGSFFPLLESTLKNLPQHPSWLYKLIDSTQMVVSLDSKTSDKPSNADVARTGLVQKLIPDITVKKDSFQKVDKNKSLKNALTFFIHDTSDYTIQMTDSLLLIQNDTVSYGAQYQLNDGKETKAAFEKALNLSEVNHYANAYSQMVLQLIQNSQPNFQDCKSIFLDFQSSPLTRNFHPYVCDVIQSKLDKQGYSITVTPGDFDTLLDDRKNIPNWQDKDSVLIRIQDEWDGSNKADYTIRFRTAYTNFTTYPVNTIEYQGQTWSVESGDIVSA